MGFLWWKSKKERYAAGFKWGKREHKFEVWTTRWLIVGILMLVGGIYLEFWHHWKFAKYLFYVALLVFIVCWIFRIIASYAHKKEKAHMDKLRFKKGKK